VFQIRGWSRACMGICFWASTTHVKLSEYDGTFLCTHEALSDEMRSLGLSACGGNVCPDPGGRERSESKMVAQQQYLLVGMSKQRQRRGGFDDPLPSLHSLICTPAGALVRQ